MLYRIGAFRTVGLPVPVVIAGSITVGGGGKTPLVQALVAGMRARGLRTAVVARGYGGSARGIRMVGPQDDPAECGDEPVMHARQDGVPVAIGADRAAAAKLLLREHADTQVVISDDGLQHYALGRDFEIAAVDASALGNSWLLPAGPLREPLSRLASCDAVVRKHADEAAPGDYVLKLTAHGFERVDDGQLLVPGELAGKRITALAGIADPQAFFASLEQLGLELQRRIALPDHHRISRTDLEFPDADAIVMTAKDAVKSRSFADLPLYALRVEPSVPAELIDRILERIALL